MPSAYDEIISAEFTAGQELALEYGVIANTPGSHWWTEFYFSADRAAIPVEPSLYPREPGSALGDLARRQLWQARGPDETNPWQGTDGWSGL